MADKKLYSVRLDEDLLEQIKDRADQENETVTAIFEEALKSFLSAPKDEMDVSIDRDEFDELRSRVERLERITAKDRPIGQVEKPEPRKTEPISPESVGELATYEELEVITGYSKKTLSSKFSRAGIQAAKRVDGNRAGLYSKSEVLEKIGKKG